MTAAFVPTMTNELEQSQRAGAFALVSKVSSWLLVVTISAGLMKIYSAAPLGFLEAGASKLRERGTGAADAGGIRALVAAAGTGSWRR